MAVGLWVPLLLLLLLLLLLPAVEVEVEVEVVWFIRVCSIKPMSVSTTSPDEDVGPVRMTSAR